MNAGSNRGFPRKSATFLDKRIFDQPENIGNRRTFDEIKIPPDNVGNKIDRDPISTFIHDGLGNSLDDEPSHLKSGLLPNISGLRNRQIKKSSRQNFLIDSYNSDDSPKVFNNNVVQKTEKVAKIRPLLRPLADKKKIADANKMSTKMTDEEYAALMAEDFVQLLKDHIGTPFSFSMKTMMEKSIDKVELYASLKSLKNLIEEILKISAIDAEVYYLNYCTENHRFAVFFINPEEKDPIKNKDLISALRQIVISHVAKFISDDINVLLVLANARNIIEGHLAKIGAGKIEED